MPLPHPDQRRDPLAKQRLEWNQGYLQLRLALVPADTYYTHLKRWSETVPANSLGAVTDPSRLLLTTELILPSRFSLVTVPAGVTRAVFDGIRQNHIVLLRGSGPMLRSLIWVLPATVFAFSPLRTSAALTKAQSVIEEVDRYITQVAPVDA